MPSINDKQTQKLVKIDFNRFEIKNPDYHDAFESLSYHLFCRRFRLTSGLFRYKNQIGIETEPARVRGREVGFQAKYFETSIDKRQLIGGLKKAKDKHPKISKIIFYINKEFSEGKKGPSSKSLDEKAVIEEAAKLNVKIEWVIPSNLDMILNLPGNADLAQFYFGAADNLGFIQNCVNPSIQTFLQSNEFLHLPISCDDKVLKKPAGSILRRRQKTFLLIGNPGSGKSIYIHYLFREYSGLSRSTANRMIQLLVSNEAIPMIVNLKDCIHDTLENLIRTRKTDSYVQGQSLGFIYLLDGLDELTDERADQVLSFLQDLEQDERTKKIVISCRSGNINRIRTKAYFPEIKEYIFSDLNKVHIDEYFAALKDKKKIKALAHLTKSNRKLLVEIKDILLIRLLWETVEVLDPNITVTEMIEQQVMLLMSDPKHKKNIESLNLLDAKTDELIALNQEISFKYSQIFQYRFSKRDLQDIIIGHLPKLTYREINEVINYISNLFFECPYTEDDTRTKYNYRHRRYQEFFFTQRLKVEYEKDPSILRSLDVLSNREYIEGYFLPYVRRKYEQTQNVIGLIDLNLLDVYLGKHVGFGVDDAYYLSSPDFFPALASQKPVFINELLESGSSYIRNILFIDLEELKDKLYQWGCNQGDYRLSDYLCSIWSNNLGSLIVDSMAFWKEGHKSIAKRLLSNLDDALALFREKRFIETIDQNRRPNNPFWLQWESYLFILICIKRKNIGNIYKDIIRPKYGLFKDESEYLASVGEGKDKLISAFFKVTLGYKPSAIYSSIDKYDDYELINLLGVLNSPRFIRLFTNSTSLQRKIKNAIETRKIVVTENSNHIAFYKVYLGLKFSDEERDLLEGLLVKLRNERKVNWRMYGVPVTYAYVSFGLGLNDFNSLKRENEDDLKYFDELGLYSALFAAYIDILMNNRCITEVVRGYLTYIVEHDDRFGLNLGRDISALWAHIFDASKTTSIGQLINLKNMLLKDESNIIPYVFCSQLSSIDKKLFDRLINENDLVHIEAGLLDVEDYQSLVDQCFSISLFYVNLNEQKSKLYFIKGLNEGILRHGWRKDSLVSYQLVEALDVLWRNNWDTKDNLVKFTKEVINLARKVVRYTDGAATWRGPYNVVDLAAKYDIELAEELMNELLEHAGYGIRSNEVITSVLLGKISLGFPIENIEDSLRGFRKIPDHRGISRSDFYEQKTIVYIAIAESEVYLEEERRDALNKAYDLIEVAINEDVSNLLLDEGFRDLKLRYIALCKKYEIKSNVEVLEKNDINQDNKEIPEKDLVAEINRLDTKSKILDLYKKIDNYSNGIVLSKRETWKTLLEQTYKVLGNIQPFIKLLERSYFPHTDFFAKNSRYFHLGLAVALANINMKLEAINHLHKDTGHGGFVNMMKVYEVIQDKQMCKGLFARYLQLCHFLCD